MVEVILHKIPVPLNNVEVGEPVPAPIFVKMHSAYILFRVTGDTISSEDIDRLTFRKVNELYINEKDEVGFSGWLKKDVPADTSPVGVVKTETKRALLDIFQNGINDQNIKQAVASSKSMATQMLKNPYVGKALAQLRKNGSGIVDHSVNVGVLSTYLGMQMGYTQQVILSNLSMGGILHDIGKSAIDIKESDTDEEVDEKLKEHPTLGAKLAEELHSIPEEVKLIISMHHENYDGSGYPKGLKKIDIFDLAKIVSIANKFDRLVSNSSGDLAERQKRAITDIGSTYQHEFNPTKLGKALKILSMGV